MSSENDSFQPTLVRAEDDSLDELLQYLLRTRGFDFTAYKRPSLSRRIEKRMGMVSVATFADYMAYLDASPNEFLHLFNTILINVTSFFRDAEAWSFLRESAVPQMALRSEGDPIRVWSAGCASGQEAYSIAMLLAEQLGIDALADRVKIYATDVDDEAMDEARRAVYGPRQVESVPPELLKKYFTASGDHFVLDRALRRAVIFGRHDLIQDAPISRLSLLACRNTLMYFTSKIQSRIMTRFHFAMKDEGLLFLGKAEMFLSRSELFTPVDLRRRLFKKLNRVYSAERFRALAPLRHDTSRTAMSNTPEILSIAFDVAPTAQVVVDAGGMLATFNERARALFGLVPADVGRPFDDLEVSYRPAELRALVQTAQEQRRPFVVKDVHIEGPGREARSLDVQVTPLVDGSGRPMGVGIAFTDSSRVLELQEQLSRSKQDLETTYEELQSTNEELETTNEELQSTVEELETTNEELQSTNEELVTMNEELQSTNEELQSINEELRDSSDALNQVNFFLESVLRGMRGAVMVVNRDLHVIAWNHRSEDLWGLRAEEVRNKNVFGLDIGLPIEQLRHTILACLNSDSESLETAVQATNRRGKAIRCKVTCSPLRGANDVQGVILMVDELPPETAL